MSLVSYTHIPIEDNHEPLVELSQHDFILDPAYYKQGLARNPEIYARRGIREKLLQVQSGFDGKYRIKVWDIYRPREVQGAIYDKFWKELQEKNPSWDTERLYQEVGKFVSPPYQTERIPSHVTGGAVDITLTDSNGNDLDMGSIFDSFTPEDAPFYFDIHARHNAMVIRNRALLREAMLGVGFTLDADEWWHFDYGNQMWALKNGLLKAIYGEASL